MSNRMSEHLEWVERGFLRELFGETLQVAPLGIPVTSGGVKDVWDVFIKPGQGRGDIQSVEERGLMPILRWMYSTMGELETHEEEDAKVECPTFS